MDLKTQTAHNGIRSQCIHRVNSVYMHILDHSRCHRDDHPYGRCYNVSFPYLLFRRSSKYTYPYIVNSLVYRFIAECKILYIM